MNRCKTCRNWVPYAVQNPNGSSPAYEKAGGYCHSPKIAEDPWEPYAPDAMVYPYREGCDAFWTGPLFGCVHHIEKDKP
jgi:hypothetical protein